MHKITVGDVQNAIRIIRKHQVYEDKLEAVEFGGKSFRRWRILRDYINSNIAYFEANPSAIDEDTAQELIDYARGCQAAGEIYHRLKAQGRIK